MTKVPLEEAQDKEEAKPEIIRQGPEQDLMGIAENIEYHRVADFLEIDYSERQDPNLAGKIDAIYRWGQDSAGSEDRIEALMAIKNLTKAMGITDRGTEKIKKLYKWIKLDTTRKRIEKEMELLK